MSLYMLKAALHVHSTYSDGEFTLSALKQLFLDEGCSVVGISDHDDHFDRAKLADYISECAALSDDTFLFLCGLEYRCEQEMHILGFGCETLAQTQDPQGIIRHIEEHDGLAVIAHPKDSMFPLIETLDVLPLGIETWNSKYDGRYAPRPGTFDLLYRLRSRRAGMKAFYGQDLHWKKQFRGLFVEADCPSNQPADILNALARGAFRGQKGAIELPSTGVVSADLLAEFGKAHDRSNSMWRFLKSAKRALDRMGIPVPQSLKSHLRRIF